MAASTPGLAELGRVYARYLNAVVLHGLATAQATGIGPTDLYAIGALTFEGRMTSGALAIHTGLTTGATTRLIDRLEQRGLVRRVPDPADRRRVLVEAVESDELELDRALAPARQKLGELFASYSSEQLEVLIEHFEEATPAYQEAIAELRGTN